MLSIVHDELNRLLPHQWSVGGVWTRFAVERFLLGDAAAMLAEHIDQVKRLASHPWGLPGRLFFVEPDSVPRNDASLEAKAWTLLSRVETWKDIANLINSGELLFAVQPVLSVVADSAGEIKTQPSHYEVLLRTLNKTPPDMLFRVAGDLGKDVLLDTGIFDAVATLLKANPNIPSLAVNMRFATAMAFGDDPMLQAALDRLVQAGAGRVSLELTESPLQVPLNRLRPLLNWMKENDVTLWLDDVGSHGMNVDSLRVLPELVALLSEVGVSWGLKLDRRLTEMLARTPEGITGASALEFVFLGIFGATGGTMPPRGIVGERVDEEDVAIILKVMEKCGVKPDLGVQSFVYGKPELLLSPTCFISPQPPTVVTPRMASVSFAPRAS